MHWWGSNGSFQGKKAPPFEGDNDLKDLEGRQFLGGICHQDHRKKRVVVSHVIKTDAIFYFMSYPLSGYDAMDIIHRSDSLLWHPKILATEQLLGGSAAGTSSKTSQVSGRALLLQTCDTLGIAIWGDAWQNPTRFQVSMVFGEVKLLVACLLIFYEGLLWQISSQTSARKMFTKLESNPSTVSITTSFDKNCPNGICKLFAYQNRALSPTQVGGWVLQSTFKNHIHHFGSFKKKLAPKNSHVWKNPGPARDVIQNFTSWLLAISKNRETPQSGWWK